MAKTIQAIRGMNDCAPTESPLWQWIEAQVRDVLNRLWLFRSAYADCGKYSIICTRHW